MPYLNGFPILDENGDGILDGTDVDIGEAALQVVIVAGGFVMGTLTKSDPEDWMGGFEVFADLVKTLLGKDGHEGETSLAVDISGVAANAARLVPTTGTIAQKLDLIDTHVLAIPTEAGSGGLTTEEHNALLALYNLDYDQIASTVWGYTLSVNDMNGYDREPMALTVLTDVWHMINGQLGYIGLPIPDRPHFNYVVFDGFLAVQWMGLWTNTAPSTDLPILDFSLVQAGDTVWSFLNREYSSYGFSQAGPEAWPTGGGVWKAQTPNSTQAFYRCTLTDADIAALWPVDVGSITINVPMPPTRPADTESLTYSSTIPLANQVSVPGPLDGLEVVITTLPANSWTFDAGDYTRINKVGFLTFLDADGLADGVQFVSYQSELFIPQRMARAASAQLTFFRDVVGTVRSWLVESS